MEEIERNDWNPMAKDYESKEFNKYISGPGAEFNFQPNVKKGKVPVKLHISNLPAKISNSGLSHLFLNIALPLTIERPPNQNPNHKQYAFVEFATRREAELAIRDLNEQPPYRLKITFAKSSLPEARDSSPRSERSSRSSEGRSSGRCAAARNLKNQMEDKIEEITVLTKRESCPGRGRASLLLKQLNLMYCNRPYNPSVRIEQQVLEQNPYYVLEREYMPTEDVDRFIDNGHETFTSSKGNPIFPFGFGLCANCHSKTAKTCKGCSAFLCSLECLENYKIIHKESCCGELETKNIEKVDERKTTRGPSTFDMLTNSRSIYLCGSYDADSIISGALMLEDNFEVRKFSQIITGLENHCNTEVSPKVGDPVLVKFDGRVLRGQVLNVGKKHEVSLIDFGGTIFVDKVYQFPEELISSPHFAVQVHLNENISGDLMFTGPEKFKVELSSAPKNGKCRVSLTDPNTDEVIAKGCMIDWIPSDQHSFPAELSDKCLVVMSCFSALHEFYVRRTDDSSDFTKFCNEVASYALRGRKLDEMPTPGQILAARYYKDGCFYRVLVDSVNGGKVNVKFIDYGNECQVTLDNLRPMPGYLKRIPALAHKVKLKGVTDRCSSSAVQYYNSLVSGNVELIYTCEPSGVSLKEKVKGFEVNVEVASLMTPGWKRKNPVRNVFDVIYCDALENVTIREGATEPVTILHYEEDDLLSSGTFFATAASNDFVEHVMGELKTQMTEYCNEVDREWYLPRLDELCLAYYMGKWMRGACVQNEISKKGTDERICDIVLVDFGNRIQISTEYIRKMIKDFVVDPALAFKYTIPGIERLANNERKKQQLKAYMQSVLKKSINATRLSSGEGSTHELLIPEVEVILGGKS